jgi:trk system potassium uptake protein TrkH
MFIGASPGGTGGGIKTTTFTLVFLSILMYRNSTRDLRINQRTIPQEIVNLAFMIFWLSVLYILSGVFILSISEPGVKFIDLMFEAFSAAGTVGLSKGVSGNLSDMGKIIDILLMYIGRIGPLTIIFSFIGERDSSRFSYPKDNITML